MFLRKIRNYLNIIFGKIKYVLQIVLFTTFNFCFRLLKFSRNYDIYVAFIKHGLFT